MVKVVHGTSFWSASFKPKKKKGHINMGFMMRKAMRTAKKLSPNLEELKESYLSKRSSMVALQQHSSKNSWEDIFA